MTTDEKEQKARRFLDRVDKRSTKKLRLKKDRVTIYLPPGMIATIDRNRYGLGFSRSAYVAFCIAKVAKPYDQERAVRMQGTST